MQLSWTTFKLRVKSGTPAWNLPHRSRGIALLQCVAQELAVIGGLQWHAKYTADGNGVIDFFRLGVPESNSSVQLVKEGLQEQCSKAGLGAVETIEEDILNIFKNSSEHYQERDIEEFLPIWSIWSQYIVNLALVDHDAFNSNLDCFHNALRGYLYTGTESLMMKWLPRIGDDNPTRFIKEIHPMLAKNGIFLIMDDNHRQCCVIASKRHLLLNTVLGDG